MRNTLIPESESKTFPRGAIALRLIVALLFPVAGWGEIEKQAIRTDEGFAFYWWPKLPSIDGWEPDRDASFHYQVNAIVPKGKGFADAETVMYAKAIYKPGIGDTKSVDDLVKNDTEHFKEDDPSIEIKQLPDIVDGDGKKLKVYRFTPAKEGNWEAVAYGSEGDFFLIFAISSRSAAGFDAQFPKFKELLGKYKQNLGTVGEKPPVMTEESPGQSQEQRANGGICPVP
ncbi:MAG: hypothetical protein IT365_01525 [Candidatus Hydrogenedentes bacterium]|nr:hypothetical protein [Candidatus Hydrogenedentota bacterium]